MKTAAPINPMPKCCGVPRILVVRRSNGHTFWACRRFVEAHLSEFEVTS